MRSNLKIIILVAIFLLAFILRFYKLGEIPNGLQQDETSIAYNAYSILQTGKDEYGKSLPLYFKAFGEYKLPVSIYLTTVPVALLGLDAFSIRLPFALLGFFTVIAYYFLVKEFIKESDSKLKYLPIASTFLLAINPWHIHFSRGVFEVVPALFLIVVGYLTFLVGIRKKSLVLLVVSAVCFAVSIYTYNIARLFTPLFVISLIYFYRKDLTRFRRAIFIPSLVFILFLLPFVLNLFSKSSYGSTTGALIYSSPYTQGELLEYRSYFIYESEIVQKIFFNRWVLTLIEYTQNLASYFSPTFYFVSGSSHGNHGVGNVGQFYLFEFTLIIVGLLASLKKRFSWMFQLAIFTSLVILIASLTQQAPHATRGFFLVLPLSVISGLGLISLYEYINNQLKNYRVPTFLIVCAVMFFSVIHYLFSYYVRFPILYASSWRGADKELSLFIDQNKNNYEKIVIDPEAGFIYSSYLFYSKFDPVLFQSISKRYPDDKEGFSKVEKINNIEFRKVDPAKDLSGNVLIVSKENNFGAETVRTIKYPIRSVVAVNNGEIIQFPVEDVAYVISKGK